VSSVLGSPAQPEVANRIAANSRVETMVDLIFITG